MTEINARAKRVLHAVVSEYLATGTAVGSHTITRRYDLDVSAATVRTVMSDLEGIGLLRHEHTSAGRIPTDRGLRYYVDTLLRVRSPSVADQETFRNLLVGAGSDPVELVQRTSRILGELSHLAVVVQMPRKESDALSHVEFMRLSDRQLLVVFVTTSGQIQNKLVPLDAPVSDGELDQIGRYLNGMLAGLTLGEVRTKVAQERESARAEHDLLAKRALEFAAAVVPQQPQLDDVRVEGQSRLVQPTDDAERLKRLLRVLEEKDRIVQLLDRTLTAPGCCVFIGSEANLEDFSDMSVVAATYGGDDRPLGAIGVIGPSRMNYSKVISLVDFTADVITEALPKL